MILFFCCSHVDHTYQDGMLVASYQLGQQHISATVDINTKACDVVHHNVKCCNCGNCVVKRTATAGSATTNTQVPASHENVFYNFPDKAMWPFKNAACLENTIFKLGDPDVTCPTYQVGQLQPPDERVRQTVTQFLAQAAHAIIVFSN